MKIFVFAFFSVFFLSVSHQSQAGEMDRVVNSLCDYAKANKRSAMRKKLKQTKLNLRRVYGEITCGAVDGFTGGSLLRVSTYFGAYDSAKFISAKIGKKGVNSTEADGKSILSWTEALVNSGSSKATNLQDFITLYKSKS